jgi:apolipoprotein N-acyltransferase
VSAVADVVDRRLSPHRRPVTVRFLVAAAAGIAVGLSWQPYGLWPLLLVGLPAFTLAVRNFGSAKPGSGDLSSAKVPETVTIRRAFALGYVFGFAMLAITVSWVHVLGVWIPVVLIAFVSVFFGLLGVALRLVSTLPAWPLAAACCWVMIEYAYSRVPFGGFGWTRLAYAAVDTPLAGFLPIIGVAGVSFLVALIGQLVAWVFVGFSDLGSKRDIVRRAGIAGLSVAVLLGAGLGLTFVPPPSSTAGSVNVGIIQGNVPGRGLEALGRMRSVTNNHLAETVNLTARSRLGQVPTPDFILWPENSTDIDPTLDPITGQTVRAAAEIAGRPILVGAVMAGPGEDERQTTALWWDPKRGITARYDKRDLVPFGEWIPFRRQLLPLLPILERVGAQSVPGSSPGVLEVGVGDRRVKIGDIICFELAYDRTIYSVLSGGAQLLLVQSNNATYGGTGQIEQQFAITRARAMEARREIAVATTNSVSGFIDAQGRVLTRTEEFTAASTVVSMPLRSQLTPAIRVAPWIDRLIAALGLLCCVLAGVRLRASGHHGRDIGQDGADITPHTDATGDRVTASR